MFEWIKRAAQYVAQQFRDKSIVAINAAGASVVTVILLSRANEGTRDGCMILVTGIMTFAIVYSAMLSRRSVAIMQQQEERAQARFEQQEARTEYRFYEQERHAAERFRTEMEARDLQRKRDADARRTDRLCENYPKWAAAMDSCVLSYDRFCRDSDLCSYEHRDAARIAWHVASQARFAIVTDESDESMSLRVAKVTEQLGVVITMGREGSELFPQPWGLKVDFMNRIQTLLRERSQELQQHTVDRGG